MNAIDTRPSQVITMALVATLFVAVSHLTFGQKIRGTVQESEFDKELKKKREAAYSEWKSSTLTSDFLRNVELDGNVLLLVERDLDGQQRAIIYQPEKRGIDGEYSTHITEPELLEQYQRLQKSGYEILTLIQNPRSKHYCVVWVEKRGYDGAVKKLASLGVTPAKIQIKPSASKIDRNTGKITSPVRQWTDKSGRIIEAALVEVDGEKAILAKKGGGQFPYLIENLSLKDQQFLKQLAADQKKPKSESSEPEGERGAFTEWMEFVEWEKHYGDERAKGRYPIYVESNNKKEIRGVFAERPKGMGWYYALLSSEESIRRLNITYQSKGLTLLALSFERRTQKYNAVWVSKRSVEAAKSQLQTATITPAKIGKKIQTSEVRKREQ